MPESMSCPNCHQPVEAGAAFCGNCGQPLHDQSDVSAVQQSAGHLATSGAGLPSYAQVIPGQHASEIKSVLSVLSGAMGIVGSVFVPLTGLVLGILGMIAGTLAHSSPKRKASTVGLIVSSLAILAGLGSLTYNINQNQQKARQDAQASQADTDTTVSADLTTPCYSVDFVDRLNVHNTAKSCNMNAYNGSSLDASTDAYKVYASKADIINAGSFTDLAKAALEKDMHQNLPNFTINSERVSGFAGSPAYSIMASDKNQDVAVVETAVFHQVTNGDNVFILVHVVNGNSTDLHILEAQWQWK